MNSNRLSLLLFMFFNKVWFVSLAGYLFYVWLVVSLNVWLDICMYVRLSVCPRLFILHTTRSGRHARTTAASIWKIHIRITTKQAN